MASISPLGERAALALIVDQYAQIVDLRETLAAAHGEINRLQGELDERTAADHAEKVT